MTTWRNVHAGDVVLGADGQEWGTLAIDHRPVRGLIAITLTRYGRTLTGRVDPTVPVTVTQPADLSELATAAEHLAAAGFHLEILSEQWESAQ